MTGHPTPRIFISYSRKDGAEFAHGLRQELEAEGHCIWQDLVALASGPHWWSQIEEALRSKGLEHFILVLTPGALESGVVRREIRLARQEGNTVSVIRGPGIPDDFHAMPRWIGHVYFLDFPEQRAVFLNKLKEPGKTSRVPMMAPEPPADFVARPREFDPLKEKLLDGKGDAVAITAALKGAGGYGKTTLAKKLAHDDDIQGAFYDGILWVELGERPENLLSVVSDLVEILSGERPGVETINGAATKLGEALGDRCILLVIDDVWREQDLRPFLQGGRNTTRLITTRIDTVLPLGTEQQPVDAMEANEALDLLAAGLRDRATAHRLELGKLAARLGEWALLLKLVNGFLRDRVLKGNQPLAEALAGVNKRLDAKGLIAFDARNETERTKAVARTIGVSLDLLDENGRARFAELGVFPEDTDVPLGIITRLWQQTGGLDELASEDLLSELANLSLLLSLNLERKTLRLHDTVRHYLMTEAGTEALTSQHRQLIEVTADIRTADGISKAAAAYYYKYLPFHLSQAKYVDVLDQLLLDPGWLRDKLECTHDPQSLVADYEQYGWTETHRLIGRTLHLATGILARDERQLITQLLGRLMTFENAEVQSFCAQALKFAPHHTLVTKRSSLTPPGAETLRLEGHTAAVETVTELADGRLASGSDDNTIRLWDADSGMQLAVLEGHTDYIYDLIQLADGRLASSSLDNTIRLWDLDRCVQPEILIGHTHGVEALAQLADGRLASASTDNTIRLWNLDNGTQLELKGHASYVYAVTQLTDGRIASGSWDKTLRLWDPHSGAELAVLEGHSGPVQEVIQLSDGRLASSSYDGTIRLWDPDDRVQLATLEGHLDWVTALIELSDGRLASGSSDNTIRLWDLQSRTQLAILEGHTNPVWHLTQLADGRLASASDDNTIRLWDLDNHVGRVPVQGHVKPVRNLTQHPDGKVASGSYDKTIRLWDPDSGVELAILEGHTGYVDAVTWLADGRLASGSYDKTVRIWDTETGKELLALKGHAGPVTALTQLADGRIASASWDKTVRLWDPQSGVHLTTLEGHTDWIFAVIQLADGRIASASRDRTIRIWESGSGHLLSLVGHSDAVWSLTQLADGRIASGSRDKTIRLWDPYNGTQLAMLKGHTDSVSAVGQLGNGDIVSAAWDKTIRLWDPSSGAPCTCLEVDARVLTLCALKDGGVVAGDVLGRLHWLEIVD